jgi:hypothetical protein
MNDNVLACDYIDLGPLADGGQAEVVRAFRISGERIEDVVLKQPKQESKRAQREIAIVRTLSHLNIERFVEVMDENTLRPTLVYQYYPSLTLWEWWGDPKTKELQSWQDVVALFIPLADALAHAHSKGICHRDLHPNNVLLCHNSAEQVKTGKIGVEAIPLKDYIPRLIDFGLGKWLDTKSAVPVSTEPGAFLGARQYFAPEQAAGDAAKVTGASDVFVLGLLLYQTLTGHHPFEDANEIKMIALLTEARPASPRVKRKALPEDLANLCLDCLDKSPRWRPTASQLTAELQRVRVQDGSPKPVGRRINTTARRARRWMRYHPIGTSLAVLALCLAAVLPFWHAWRQKDQDAKALARKNDEDDRAKREFDVSLERARRAYEHAEFRNARAVLDACPVALRNASWAEEDQKLQGCVPTVLSVYNRQIFDGGLGPTGEIFVAGCDDGSIWLWAKKDAFRTPRQLSGNGHTKKVSGVAFSPADNLLATTGADRFVAIWDLTAEKLVCRFEVNDLPSDLAFSKFGQFLFVLDSKGCVKCWEAPGQDATAWQHPKTTDWVVQHRDAAAGSYHMVLINDEPTSLLVVASPRNTHRWELTTGNKYVVQSDSMAFEGSSGGLIGWHECFGGHALVLPHSRQLQEVHLGNRPKGEWRHGDQTVTALSTCPASNSDYVLLTGMNDGAVWEWKSNGRLDRFLVVHNGTPVDRIAVSPKGDRVVTTGGGEAKVFEH